MKFCIKHFREELFLFSSYMVNYRFINLSFIIIHFFFFFRAVTVTFLQAQL